MSVFQRTLYVTTIAQTHLLSGKGGCICTSFTCTLTEFPRNNSIIIKFDLSCYSPDNNIWSQIHIIKPTEYFPYFTLPKCQWLKRLKHLCLPVLTEHTELRREKKHAAIRVHIYVGLLNPPTEVMGLRPHLRGMASHLSASHSLPSPLPFDTAILNSANTASSLFLLPAPRREK